MTKSTESRPMSPYMIGPYYKPQLTSMLSILSRLTGVFMVVVSLPLVVWWLVALALGPEAFASARNFFTSLPGQVVMMAGLFCLCYHFVNGIRHLIWDTGRMLDIGQVYRSGWIMLVSSFALYALMWVSL